MIFLQVAVLAFASLVISSTSQGASVKLDLIGKYDIKAASTGFNDPLADLDGSGRAFPAEWLPAGGSNFDYSGVEVPFFVLDNDGTLMRLNSLIYRHFMIPTRSMP